MPRRSSSFDEGPGNTTTARLRVGVARYRTTSRRRYSKLFERLAFGQSPHTLFIACSDSRIDPCLITASDPGELFTVRDIGNLVPPAGEVVRASAVGAAIDYAVGVLNVRQIVVCGHSGCGAINALLSQTPLSPHLRNLDAWLETTEIRPFIQRLRGSSLEADDVARLSVLVQLDNLKTYPIVTERLASGELSLSGWFFDIRNGEIEEWSDRVQRFVSLAPGSEPEPSVESHH